MDLARYTALFLSDSRDHLQRCNELLLEWEQVPDSAIPVAELFRAFHSIKGSAAALGLDPIAELAHLAEQVLGSVRDGSLRMAPRVLDALFQSVDGLSDGVEAVGRGEPPGASLALTEELRALLANLPLGTAPPAVERRARTRPSVAAELQGVRAARQVRVNLERLDSLLNEVSELVVARNRLAAIADREIGSELAQVSGRISVLVSGLHASVLQARMAPIGEVFDRFPRIARDLARSLGKEIRLELQGGEIELDRSVLDGLLEPLTHLIRNAADHGLETPEERQAAGKPREGALRLRAERARDGVLIVVGDNGRGIDRAAVREQAVARGLLDPDAGMPDAAGLLRLLAQSGFTTRAEVTEVSGRGVGIDAVLTRIRALGGWMELKTLLGRGTTFLLHLPVTRTIVRALLVGVGEERYAIPFALLTDAAVHEAADGEVTLRGERLPTADLRTVLGLHNGASRRRPAVVLDLGGRQNAVIVDRLLGQQDIVVERFAEPAGLPPWVGGATILPDGAPAVIIDPTGLW